MDNYDALYTSPLVRCANLAEYVTSSNRMVDERILEYNFGDWELREWKEIKKSDSIEWSKDIVNNSAPNGESLQVMKNRVDDFFDELIKRDYENVAVVTHSGVQRIIHARILNTPLSNIFRLQLDFGAVIELLHNQETEITTLKHL